ncbi:MULTISPECIES: hypothetical protein [unclassified Streptomyces]|uniref:hypothetical protein n=1 Tax=unclassified Streptomyces TaxID=2593676 RepID=UPI000C2717CF|nr:hypothetical protein [Streptomyces sp. CB02959]PJN39149.1 hypothetical protein CG747_19355 [Streptomyces sp. CB02959]
MGRKAAARRRHRTARAGSGRPGRSGNPARIDEPGRPGRTGEPGGTGRSATTGISDAAGGIDASADAAPGGRLPPRQEPKPKRPVRTIRVPGLFG